MKVTTLSTMLVLLICCYQNTYAQSEFSSEQAKDIFTTFRPKYGFEGVYEVYNRFGEKIDDAIIPNNSYDKIENKVFETHNIKVCIYCGSTGIVYFKVITEGLTKEDKQWAISWFESHRSLYKVDAFGILTNITHRDAKELWSGEDQDFITRIFNENNTLSYDIQNYAIKQDIDNHVHAYRWQFMLKKIYTP